MSLAHGPDPRGGTGASSSSEMPRLMSRSSARFGSLSHHQFFSRHNPHPSRVRHIQGLNGNPVCTVRDDWFVTSSLFPHPLLKGKLFQRGRELPLPFAHNLFMSSSGRTKSGLMSERWQEELKELAAKISMNSQQQQEKKEEQIEEEPIRRKTQYSSQTGRIIPSSSKSFQRRSYSRSQPAAHPQLLHHQELMVLELLCQILQTDSLSTVQQWLLLAGQREKDLMMGMIKQALDGMDLQNQTFGVYPHLPQHFNPSLESTWSPAQKNSFNGKPPPTSPEDKPERIGDAEVLQVHSPDDVKFSFDVTHPSVKDAVAQGETKRCLVRRCGKLIPNMLRLLEGTGEKGTRDGHRRRTVVILGHICAEIGTQPAVCKYSADRT